MGIEHLWRLLLGYFDFNPPGSHVVTRPTHSTTSTYSTLSMHRCILMAPGVDQAPRVAVETRCSVRLVFKVTKAPYSTLTYFDALRRHVKHILEKQVPPSSFFKSKICSCPRLTPRHSGPNASLRCVAFDVSHLTCPSSPSESVMSVLYLQGG